MVLRQTCRAFLTVVDDHLDRLFAGTCAKLSKPWPRNLLRPDELFDYHLLVARHSPGQWACQSCARLHPVSFKDLLGDTLRTACFNARPADNGHLWKPHSDGAALHQLRHHHVQIIFKSIRMHDQLDDGGKDYLRQLLTENNHIAFQGRQKPVRRPKRTLYCTPRVIENLSSERTPHYRLLLQHRWVDHFDGDIEARAMHDLRLCPHLEWLLPRICPPHTADVFSHHILAAIANGEGEEVCGSCESCTTDYVIRAWLSTGVVETQAWYDIGVEGSPHDPRWRMHDDINNRFRCVRQPSSTRSAFEQSERALVLPERMSPGERLRTRWQAFLSRVAQ